MPQIRQTPSTLVRSFAIGLRHGHVIEEHAHDWHQLVYAERGVLTVRSEPQWWVVPAYRAVWVPAGTRHSVETSGNVQVRTLYFAPMTRRALPRECRVVSVSPLLREIILHVVAVGALDGARPEHRHLADVLIDQLAVIPTAALRLPMPRSAPVARIAALLREAPDDARPLAALARAQGVSERTVQRCFAAETHMTFAAWRQRLRLVHALQLLAAGSSVTEAAIESGYTSVSAFIAMFRKVTGETPRRYQR